VLVDTGQALMQLGFTKEAFPAGTHICQIFSDEEERCGAITAFVEAGVREGERTICFVSNRLDPATLGARLQEHGLALEELKAAGAVSLVDAREVYFKEGRFDANRPFALFTQFHEEALKAGRSARAMGEVNPEAGRFEGGRPLVAYESRVSRFLQEKRMMAVCQYEAKGFDGATIMDILRVHPLMVLRGEVIHNPFFVPSRPCLPKDGGLTACAEARALGQILLIESLIAQLPNRLSMLRFAVRGLEDLPGIQKAWFQDEPALPQQAGRHAFPISYDGHCHAVLHLAVADEGLFALYFPYVKNLAFLLGVVLNERLQRDENERYRTQLEALIATRTQALVESEDRARAMLRTALDGVWLVDVQDRLLEVNEAACTMLGYSHGEMLRMRVDQIETQNLQAHLSWLRQHGSRLFESRHRRKDGTDFPVEVSGTYHPDRGQTVVFVRDITERKRAEEALLKDFEARCAMETQVAQAQQLESLGRLAGGVAHDMNNVLGAILALATSNGEDFPEDSPIRSHFDIIAKAAVRGGQMVKGLLSFARQAPMDKVAVDLNAVLKDVAGLLARTTLARIRLAIELDPALPTLRGDASSLAHAVMNLCINAVDAMPGEGELTLRTRKAGARWIEVQVQDSGSGMTPEVSQKALAPFFTTKPMGTGLGLSMVYGTVNAHQGRMSIQSAPGQGTCVTLTFPAFEPKPPTLGLPQSSLEAPTPAALQVLLVDDDPLIQFSVRALLGRLGHQTTSATTGAEALARLEEGYQPELVVLDLNMPGLSGAETLARLRAVLPRVPVIIATGKPDQAAQELVTAYAGVALLPKPFTMLNFRSLLEELRG
jgi:PAS domain S-box-containing protein